MNTATSERQAVALEWDGSSVPRVTASGSGLTAEMILERARQHHIAIAEEPALITLLAGLHPGESIPETLFVAVAEVLAFVYATEDACHTDGS